MSTEKSRICRLARRIKRPLRAVVRHVVTYLAICATVAAGVPASAATYYWDPDANSVNNSLDGTGLGGTGIWDTTTPLWWNTTGDVVWPNSFSDSAVFTGTAGTITLGGAINAGSLQFKTDGYLLTGGTLTLGGLSAIDVGLFSSATIDSLMAGSAGLLKTGGGTLRVTNIGNTFSGDVAIGSGGLVITDARQLGTGTSTIAVAGYSLNTGVPGYTGGALMLQGGLSGLTLNRDVSLAGRGPGVFNGAGALMSLGNNTINGDVVLSGVSTEARAMSVYGNTVINGTLQLGAGQGSIISGNGNFIIAGQVTGFDAANQDRFIKSGTLIGSTMWLQNANNDFAQPLRLDSGTVRVTSAGALGSSISNLAVDFNNGGLEVRTDDGDFTSRNFFVRGATANIFVDHNLGSSLQNQTVQFGNFNISGNATIAMTGRNGYNLLLGSGQVLAWSAGGLAFSNTSSGTLTIDASVSHASETTARNVGFTTSGEIIFTGDILQAVGSASVGISKANTGMLILQGTGTSTATGSTTIGSGTITASSFNQLPTGDLLIGNATTTSGAFNYVGAGETSSKRVTINTTTANAYINSNGTGALVLNGPFVTVSTGAAATKTLVLGGANTSDNEIASAILNPAAGSMQLQKTGAGTWVLSGANTFTGTATTGVIVSGGTLKIKDTFASSSLNVIDDTNSLIFNTDVFTQMAGGTFQYVGAADSASSETLNALIATTGLGTIQVLPGTGVTASATLNFTSLGARSNGAVVNVLGTGAVNIGGTSGFLNAGILFNGVDFAYSGAGTTLRAPIYSGSSQDAGFALAAGALVATSHNLADADTSTGAVAINSLKLSGAVTVTQTGLLTINNGANTPGGIIADGGASTITGTGVTTAGSGDLVVQVTGGSQLTMAAPVTSSTTGGLTKSGAGLLVLQGSQAYTGATTINQGTILIDTGSRLGGSVNNNLTIRQDGTLDLFGNTIGVAAFNGAGSVINTDTGTKAILTVGNNNQSGYFTGSISGNIQLIKAGSGTTSLTGVNTYTGPTVLTSGVLAVTNLANIGTSSAIGKGDATDASTNAASLIFNGGTLQYTGATSVIYQNTQTPSVTIDRLFTMAANGVIDSSGSFGAPTLSHVANHASLIFGNTGDIAFMNSGNRTLTLQGDSIGDNTMMPRLIDNPNTGVLNITKSGNGLWILGNSNNAYTGTTQINAGALQAVDGGSLPTDSNLFLNGGVFQTSGTFDRTLGTGSDEFRFSATTAGGFSSSTAKLTVDFGVLNGPIWGSTAGFLGGNAFILSSNTALADTEVKGNFELLAGVESSTISLTTTNSSSTITVAGGGTTAGLTIGQKVSGLNIPAGSYITSISGNTTFTINQNTNSSGAATGTGNIAGGGYRDVVVNDNGSTNLDFATISGVMSGTGGLSKTASGTLLLGDANTYSGNTLLRQGNLFVTSIGSAGATSSSLGTNVGGGVLDIGNPNGSDTVNLMYVGSGETATRTINLIGTTGTRRIDSSGTGALILTNLFNSTATAINTNAGAKTLEIRGVNVDGNMITSVLADNGGALTITKADSGTWILNPTSSNLFTGVLNANGGSLGLTSDGIGNAASLTISNGSIFGYGGDLTITRPLILANNAAAGFVGSNNITISGNLTKAAGANDQTIDNTLDAGKTLRITGNFVSLETATATRTINWRGTGATVLDGVIRNNSANAIIRFDMRMADSASLTLNGNSAADSLGFTGGFVLGNGTLILGTAGALGPSANNFILDGGVLTSTVDLSGANKITNRVFLQGDPVVINGNQNIEFGAASGATFELNGNRQLINDLDPSKLLTVSGTINLTTDTNVRTLTIRGTGNTLISGTIANGGTGASILTMAGLGDLRITSAATATGALNVNRGRVILSGSGAWTAGTLTLNPNATLLLENAGSTARLPTGAVNSNAGRLEFSGAATQSTGNLALNLGTTSISTDSTLSLTFASVTIPNTGSSLNLMGVPNLGTTNKVIFTAALPAGLQINNIMPRIIVSGDDFSTYAGNTNGVEIFSAYNNGNDLNAAAATDTLNLTTSADITLSKTVNALKLNGSGIVVGGNTGTTLTLSAAAILNTGGDNTLDATMVNFGGTTAYVQTKAGTTLTSDSALLGSGGLAKVQDGTLVLNTQNFYTSTTNVLAGTLKLNGGLNTLFPNQILQIQSGATLDLNGNTQWTAVLSDPGAASGNGGTITSSNGFGTYVTNISSSATAMTQITGSVNFVRLNTGTNTLTLGSAQAYTGSTTLLGGTLTLQDEATILNSTVIDINNSALVLGNNSGLQIGNNDRIGDAIPINLRDGTFQFNGRVNTASTERLGVVSSLQGANTIALNTGGTGTAGAYTSSDVTFADFVRSAGTTVNFTGSALGQVGNNNRLYFDTTPTTVLGGALGAWAIANANDYAGYNAATGVGAAGTGGYVGYSSTFGSGNITNLGLLVNNFGTSASGIVTTNLAGNTTTALLRLNGVFQNDITFATAATTLNLEQGGLLRAANAFSTTIGTPTVRGRITAGGTESSGLRELVIYSNMTASPTFGGAASTVGTTRVTMSSTQGLAPGMTITGAGLSAGTTIASIDSLTQITISQPASSSQTGQTYTAGVYVSGSTSLNSQTVTMNTTTGLMPGMTITGTGIPAGTYIQSVDSATQVTISQNATSDNTGLTLTAGVGNIIVNSVIADNGFGNSVQLVKSGAGVLNLTAANTYTGGTIVNQGTLNLIGTGITIPAGGLVINNSTVTMFSNGGQIDSSNAVTLRRSAVLNLLGDNTLDSLSFDNSGGTTNPTVVIGAGNTLTLNNAGPVTVLNSNASAIPTISLGTLALQPGVKTFSIQGPTAAGQLYTTITSSLNITSVITGVGTTINKTGSGILQLGAQNTFDGGLTLNQGGILLSASSTSVNTQSGIASGPIGTGTLTAAAGTTILIDSSRTLNNELVFTGGPLNFDTTANSAWTLTMNGKITLPTGALTIRVGNPNMTVSMLGNITNMSQVTSITKTGLGVLLFNSTGYTGDFNAGQLGNPTSLSIFNDGDGTGRAETIQLGNIEFGAGIVPTITIGRAGQNFPYTLPANKILAATSVDSINGGLTLTNNHGYGLLIPNDVTLTGTPTFSVSAASNSNVTQGLYLTGLLSGTGFTKIGAGTMVLGNAGNTFTGDITINQGVVSISNDGQFGNSTNKVILAPTTGTSTLRATADVTTSHAIQFAGTANTRAIEVTTGNTLQLNSAFDLNGGAGNAAALVKNDNGTLAINAANSSWTGALTINGGAVLALNNNALGSGTITVNTGGGSALQLAGGVTIANPFTTSTANPSTGIDSGGVIESISGNNTYSGAITQPSGMAVMYGARAGATLNLTGTYNSVGANSVTFSGAGDVNVSSVLNNGTTFNKIGSGTLTLTGANNLNAAIALNFNAGTTVFRGTGRVSSASGTGRVTVDVGATLTLDNTFLSGGNVNNRLGFTRPITFRGGNFNLLGANGSTTTETLASPTFARGLSVITVVDGGNGTNLLFTGSANVPTNAQNSGTPPSGTSILFRGTQLGAAAGNGVATIKNTGATNGFAFNGQNGATGTKNKGLMPYALVDTDVNGSGISFATGDSGGTTNAGTIANIRPLAANEYETANTVTASNNLLLNGSSTTTVTANLTAPNSITFDAGSGANVGLVLNQGILFNLSSGGILVRSGVNATISGAGVFSQTSGFSPLNFWTVGDLTISTVMHGGNGTANGNIGVVKAGAGTLTISTPLSTIDGLTSMSANSMSGQWVINQGTVVLDSGKNTIQANNYLALNGGTLDLHGNSQQIFALFTDSAVAFAGGTVTSSVGQGHFIINQDNAGRNFAGQITGNLKLTRSGINNLSLYSPQTYTGSSVFNGGTTILRDSATLLNTPSIDLSYAQLTLDNTGTLYIADRLSDTAPITMRGATLQFSGRAQTNSSESVGAITLAQSNSTITASLGGTNINGAELTIASLTRTTGGGTVNFGVGGQLGSSSRIYIGSLNGTPLNTIGDGLTNNILGGWAIANTSDFATYAPGIGVGGLGQTGFAAYSTLALSSAGRPTDNIRVNYTAPSSLLENTTINSVKFDNVVLGGVAIAAGKTLTLASGGFLNFTTTPWNFGGVVNQGFLTSGGPELFIYTQGSGTPTINTIITGAGMSLVKSGGNTLVLAATNDYTGGTFVNQGIVNLATTGLIPAATNPANGLVISGTTSSTTVNANAPGAIAASNIVTVNGNGILNLYGDNSLYGLVLNNNGGTANPTIASFTNVSSLGGLIGGATGTLTIGAGGVTATASNLGTVNLLAGRFDFGSSPNTISVGSIDVNGETDVAPLQSGLVLQGVVGSSGGITKSGAGVLGLNAQMIFTGPLNVTAGSVRIGATNGGSRFSTLNLGAGTTLNIAGLNTALGSLAGSGTVFNTGGAVTLTLGFNNESTTFSGRFSRFNDAIPNAIFMQKVGTGTLTFTGVQSSATGASGTITINGGGLTFADDGRWFVSQTSPVSLAETFTIGFGGKLTLDNSGTNVNGRLGLGGPGNDGVAPVAGTLNLSGGTLNIIGNASTSTTEWIGTFNVNGGGGRIDLAADANQSLRLALNALSNRSTNSSGVITGINGSAVGTPGIGVLTIAATAPQMVGGSGSGPLINIRPDLLGDATVGGEGTGFLVLDVGNQSYRAMDVDNETQSGVGAWVSNNNASLLTSQVMTAVTTSVNSLTTGARTQGSSSPVTLSATQYVNGTASEPAFGRYYRTGAQQLFVVTSGGVLIRPDVDSNGATIPTVVNIEVGAMQAGTNPYFHVLSNSTLNLNVGMYYGGGSGQDYFGFLKTGAGTLNFNTRYYTRFYNTNALTVNGGTLNLNSGSDNSFPIFPGYTNTTGITTIGVTVLNMNGTDSVLDLKGKNQIVGSLNSFNVLPGYGGTIRTTGGDAVFTSNAGGNFSGVLADGADGSKLSFVRSGSTTSLFTAASTYTGSTTIRGGTIQLRDSGSIAGSSSISIQYGTLLLDNSNLNPANNANPTRVSATAPVTMQGGTIQLTPGGSVDNTANFGAVTLTGGANQILPTIVTNQGIQTTINIVNLDIRQMITAGGTLHINGVNAGLGGVGINQGNLYVTQYNGAPAAATAWLGPNVIFNNGEYGGYSTTFGFGPLAGSGSATNFGNYSVALVSGVDTPTAINNNGAGFTISANTTTGALRFGTNSDQTIAFTAGTEILNLALGGLLQTNNGNTFTIGSTSSRGVLTAGGTSSAAVDFVLYNGAGTMNIHSLIRNSDAAAPLRFVKSGGGTLNLSANNTYTGGTVINQGTVNLNGSGVVIPAGGLTINNATVTQNTNNGQIASTNDVTLNGGAVLNINIAAGSNTLNSLTFNNPGSTVAPAVNLGTGSLTLTATNAITSINDNPLFVPTISNAATGATAGTGTLFLTGTDPVINVGGSAALGLTIAAKLDAGTGTLTKTGTGTLSLTSGSAITAGAVNLDQGTIIVGSTGGTAAVLNNPLGTGPLRIGNVGDAGITSLSGFITSFSNQIDLRGNLTIGGSFNTHSIRLTGNIDFGTGTRTITVAHPSVTLTTSAVAISTATTAGTDFLVKAGLGTWVIGQAPVTGWNGAGVWIKEGLLQTASGGAASIAEDSPLKISAGAGFDLNGASQTLAGLSDGATGSGGFITNNNATSVTLTLNAATDSTFSGAITDTATATANRLAFTKNGAGTLTLNGTNSYSGVTNVNAGGLIINGTVSAAVSNSATPTLSTSVNVASGATLGGSGVIGTTTNLVGTLVTVAGGAVLDFRDSQLDNLQILAPTGAGTNLILGDATAATKIYVDLGSLASTPTVDQINISGNFKLNSLGASVILNPLSGLVPTGTGRLTFITFSAYDATSSRNISIDSTSPQYFAGTQFTLDTAPTNHIDLVYSPIANPLSAYWKGGVAVSSTSWNSFTATGSDTNFFTTAAATTNTLQVPGSGTNVFFAADNYLAGNLATTLDANFTINSLNFNSSTGSDPISIAPGSVATNSLTIQATTSSGNPANRGITIATGTQSPITISADIVMGSGAQTWLNNGAGTLTISGNTVANSTPSIFTVDGTGNTIIRAALNLAGSDVETNAFTKSGSGKLTLTGANDFNVPVTIDGGIVEVAETGKIGNGTITIGDPATLNLNQTNTLYLANYIKSSGNSAPGFGGQLNQLGTGTTVLMNNNLEFRGNVNVSQGTLVSTDPIGDLTGGLVAASTITVGATSGSAVLVAAGTVSTVDVQDRGVLSPGASATGNHEVVDQLQVAGTATLAAGSTFRFQFLGGLQDVGGTGEVTTADRDGQLAAANAGAWDLLSAFTLDLANASSSNRINLQLISMNDPSTAGTNPGSGYAGTSPLNGDFTPGNPETLHWLFATAGGVTLNGQAFTGDINDYFQIDGSQVVGTAATPVAGSFYVTLVNGSDLYLNYAAVPEPGSMLLIGVAGVGFGLRWRKRRKAARKQAEEAPVEAAASDVAQA